MEKYRIKEEKYESGKSKFFPQVLDVDLWKSISWNVLGFNRNGLDWCTTYDEAESVINLFKQQFDKVVEEKIYEVS